MGKRLDRTRGVIDDVLRLVGVWGLWALVGTTLTTFAATVAVTVFAYLRGVRGTWLAFLGGLLVALLFVLLAFGALWLVQRARVRRAAEDEDGDIPAGFLENKREGIEAMREIGEIQARFSVVIQSITTYMHRSIIVMAFLRPRLNETWNDRLTRFLANHCARTLRRKGAIYRALIEQYEATAGRAVATQGAWFTWLLKQDKKAEELLQIRLALAQMSTTQATNITVTQQWADTMGDPEQATRRLIAATRNLSKLALRSKAATETLMNHAHGLIQQIDRKLKSAAPSGAALGVSERGNANASSRGTRRTSDKRNG
jgi:hypothetical protein